MNKTDLTELAERCERTALSLCDSFRNSLDSDASYITAERTRAADLFIIAEGIRRTLAQTKGEEQLREASFELLQCISRDMAPASYDKLLALVEPAALSRMEN